MAAGAVRGVGPRRDVLRLRKVDNPVRVGVIGTGDEGNVLIGGCTPEYVEVVAIADIRPYNMHRAFHGDWATPGRHGGASGPDVEVRLADENAARKHIKVYDATTTTCSRTRRSKR